MQQHQALAQRVAYLVVGDASEAEDLAQEAFVKAFRALDRFDESKPFTPWLCTIVRNEARNRRRRFGRQAGLQSRLAFDRALAAIVPTPEAAAIEAEQREQLWTAISHLPPGQRAVIQLRYLAGLSEAETAATLGIPPGTVKSRAARALDSLGTALEAAT